jgi:hypothetical protein
MMKEEVCPDAGQAMSSSVLRGQFHDSVAENMVYTSIFIAYCPDEVENRPQKPGNPGDVG